MLLLSEPCPEALVVTLDRALQLAPLVDRHSQHRKVRFVHANRWAGTQAAHLIPSQSGVTISVLLGGHYLIRLTDWIQSDSANALSPILYVPDV